MKLSIASPLTGTQKVYEIDDERKLQLLNDKRLGQEFDGEILGDQFKGYKFKITGGQDKQGFPMKQGVLTNSRVRLLLTPGDIGFQAWRARRGERRRKSVRGCIVGPDIAALNIIISQEGEEKLEGLNDHVVPRRLGPKRAGNIRKLFGLSKEDDVRKFVIRRQMPAKPGKKARSKAPKIQRLITPIVLERKRRKAALIKQRRARSKEERTAYQTMLNRRRVVNAHRKKARAMVAVLKQKKREIRKEKKELREKRREQRKARLAKKAAKSSGKKGSAKAPVKKGSKASAKPQPKSSTKTQAKPQVKAPAKAAPKAQAKPQAKASAKAQAKPQPKAQAKAQPKGQGKGQGKGQAKPQAKQQAKPQAKGSKKQ